MIGIESPLLLRLALAFCPREFRIRFGEELWHDLNPERSQPLPLLRTCWNVLVAGVQLHAETFVRDLRFAFRSFLKAPLFSIVSIGTIAVAVGVNVAIASIVANVLLRPLPFPNSDRLAFVGETFRSISAGMQLPYPDAQDITAGNRTLGAVSLSRSAGYTLSGSGTPQELTGRQIDANFFSLIGARVELGRGFTASDMGTKRALISESLWRTTFGESSTVLGRIIKLNGTGYQIVGVAPGIDAPDDYGLISTDVWVPIPIHEPQAVASGGFNYSVIVRVKPGVDFTRARSDIERIVSRSAAVRPSAHGGFNGVTITPVLDRVIGPFRILLWLFYAAVGVVLIVACANVASLQLGRAAARESERVVRAALGASMGRLVAQATMESAVLTAVGCAIGLLLGQLTLFAFAQMGATNLPRWEDVAIDGPMFAYAAILVVFVTLCTGTIPALTGRSGAGAAPAKRIRSGLVVTEITLAMALCIAAGLVLRSFVLLTHVNVGFDAQNTYWINTGDLPKTVIQRAERELSEMGGALTVAGSSDAPFSGENDSTGFELPGGTLKLRSTPISFVEPAYFHALGIPLLRGRYFTGADRTNSRPVTIVSATFARAFFGTTNVLGRFVVPEEGDPSRKDQLPHEVIGVVGDTRDSFSGPAQARAYLPLSQGPYIGGFLVRMSGRIAPSAKAIDAIFARLAPTLAPPVIFSYQDLLARDALEAQSLAELFGFFSLIALILALSGVYAVCAYGVERRTHELGIRRAVGARASDVLRDVIAGALRHSVIGIAAGIVLAAIFTRTLTGILFQTSALDPLTFALVALALIACTLAAAVIPASRAARMDPISALRYE